MTVKELASPLFQARGWLKYLGNGSLLGGVLGALTGFGLLLAWVPIWQGVLLIRAGRLIELAYHQEDGASLREVLESVKIYFILMGVLSLGGALLLLLSLFGLIGFSLFGGLDALLGQF